MKVRLHVDAARCIGSGQCVLTAPTVFDQDDDGIVVVLEEEPDAVEDSDVRQAAALCPAMAITLIGQS